MPTSKTPIAIPDATQAKVRKALHAVTDRLLSEMRAEGYWEGWLSSSALSTATAVSALALANAADDEPRIARGIEWLSGHQNGDGGWGDTTDSPSNLATTLLAIAALKLGANGGSHGANAALAKAEGFLAPHGGAHGQSLAEAIQRVYGEDRTFAVPILMNCGLAGIVAWENIPDLPFELAVFPHRWYKLLRLQVVSYALPALIAIGLLIDRKNPPRSILRRLLRRIITPRVLKKLRQIQPEHGGFLEATPLTSFVALGLIPLYGRQQEVASKCLGFLRNSQRPDGSWPIDTNLSVWLTTATVAALAAAGELQRIDGERTAAWIAAQQRQIPHPYTRAAPGGWAWTHLAGGVVDGDDTSGAILALDALGSRTSIPAGVRWLLDLQNGDGGWPTFCRGWGKLPFDKSSPDITAHALRAICCADSTTYRRRRRRAIRQGLSYLRHTARSDGSWVPLWFGNQQSPGHTNPVLGTSRVLRALELLDPQGPATVCGLQYLLRAQNADGGWGGAEAVVSSQEETALALSAIVPWSQSETSRRALVRGIDYLIGAITCPVNRPAPIGLYFSHLWYSERLYPLIWTLDALARIFPQKKA